MADLEHVPDAGLSGQSVRGAADNLLPGATTGDGASLDSLVRHAAAQIRDALNQTGQALENTVDSVSNRAFESAANVGANIASPSHTMTESAFSWSGYFQAIGILCLLLALLWFAVWCIRKYGKFNFLPRPGSLPRDSLIMEAQMPLGPRKGLMVVRFLNKRLLLGVTEHQISLITEDVVQNESPANKFQGIMDEMRNTGPDSGNKYDSSS